MFADLHCHTTASDGTLSPSELVAKAHELGLGAVGITDHDTILGIAEAEAAGQKYGIEIVPGIELNTDLNGQEVHILGYYPDLSSRELQAALQQLREARMARVQLIVAKLVALGLQISEERVRNIAGDGAVGRPHIAQALEEQGYVKDIKDAFDKYIGQGGPAYVSRYKLTPQQGIELIRGAKGIPVLAHPGLLKEDEIIPELVACGLLGIEVKHSKHTSDDEQKYGLLAGKFGLLVTGGSDYHGPKRKLGVELGCCSVSRQAVAQLKIKKGELG